MFTVVLLSESARERLEPWQELFDPFQEDGQIAICHWNSSSLPNSLHEAIPYLSEAIKGKAEWRLLVVGTGTEDALGELQADPENPYDYVANIRKAQAGVGNQKIDLEESSIPLVRLSHLVLGFPEIGTKEFVADPSYLDPNGRTRVYASDYIRAKVEEGVAADTAADEFNALLPTRNDVQTHYHQVDLTEDEKRIYRQLVKKYEVRQTMPSEVIFLALREPLPARPVDDLRAKWSRGDRATASQFVERNGYHPACRFAVFDLHDEGHANRDLWELKYWLSILTIGINNLPASSFQADRLYAIDVSVDASQLAGTLNDHLAILATLRERLTKEIKRPQGDFRLEVQDLLAEQPVHVSFEELSGDELSVPVEGYGLASDHPSSEMSRWMVGYSQVETAAQVFNRKPKRVLAKAVEGVREAHRPPELPTESLTDIEKDELKEELAVRSGRLAEATTREILNKRKLDETLKSHKSRIQFLLKERMPLSTILVSSALVGLIWLVVLLSPVVEAARLGTVALAESILVILLAGAILAIVAVTTLIFMRQRLMAAISDFNGALRAYVNSVKDKATAFGNFLTDLETYMYGKRLLQADEIRQAGEVTRRHRLQVDLARIHRIMEREKSLIRSVDRPVEIHRGSRTALDLQSWSPQSLRVYLRLAPGYKKCGFNHSGDTIDAPFNFVHEFRLQDLSLKEDSNRHSVLLEDLGYLGPLEEIKDA